MEFREELNKLEIPELSQKLAIISTSGETKYGNMLDALSVGNQGDLPKLM